MENMAVQWRLRELLETEGVSVYALSNAMGGETRRPALYAITTEDVEKRPQRVTFQMLDAILDALEALTGKQYAVADLLERVPSNPGQA